MEAMVVRRILLGTLIWCASARLPAGEETGLPTDVETEFRRVKAGIQHDLRGKSTEARLAAVRKLEGYPTLDSARLLVQHGLTSSDTLTRAATCDSLRSLAGDAEIRAGLRVMLEQDTKKKEPSPWAVGLLYSLISLDWSRELDPEFRELGDHLSDNARRGRVLLISLADELAEVGGRVSYQSVTRLTKTRLFHDDFATRRAVVQSLIHFREPEAVSLLIEMLEATRGEVRADIFRHLAAISGKNYESQDDWLKWWREQQPTFAFPAGGLSLGEPARRSNEPSDSSLFQGVANYYDLPLNATRVVFVIDTSGSMRGLRIVRAKDELLQAISGLRGDTAFGVVSFSGSVRKWQNKLVMADAKNKQRASDFVKGLEMGRNTASYDALKAALQFDAESIYFVTDGMPNGGKIGRPEEIVAAITGENRWRRVTINSIGVGLDPAGERFDEFLRTLATQNFGKYRRVDR